MFFALIDATCLSVKLNNLLLVWVERNLWHLNVSSLNTRRRKNVFLINYPSSFPKASVIECVIVSYHNIGAQNRCLQAQIRYYGNLVHIMLSRALLYSLTYLVRLFDDAHEFHQYILLIRSEAQKKGIIGCLTKRLCAWLWKLSSSGSFAPNGNFSAKLTIFETTRIEKEEKKMNFQFISNSTQKDDKNSIQAVSRFSAA